MPTRGGLGAKDPRGSCCGAGAATEPHSPGARAVRPLDGGALGLRRPLAPRPPPAQRPRGNGRPQRLTAVRRAAQPPGAA